MTQRLVVDSLAQFVHKFHPFLLTGIVYLCSQYVYTMLIIFNLGSIESYKYHKPDAFGKPGLFSE